MSSDLFVFVGLKPLRPIGILLQSYVMWDGGGGAVVLVEMDVARTKTRRV